MSKFYLIDREALGIGKAKREAFENPAYADGWNSAIEIVNNAPPVDAVEVVRCKDCKHRGMEGACPKCFEVCVDDDGYNEYYTIDNAKDEGFCDRGERWDENAAD